MACEQMDSCAKIKHITRQHVAMCHAMCECLLAASPHTLACHLTSLSHLFQTPNEPLFEHPPPDASHLLITPANLVEVRAQAAKCPPLLTVSAPVAFHFPPQKGCQIWARAEGGETDRGEALSQTLSIRLQ